MVEMTEKQWGYYKELKRLAKEKGWRLLSKNYTDSSAKYNFECSEKHEFSKTPGAFRSLKNCGECAIISQKIDYYNSLKQIAKERGWKVISESYLGSREKMLFECPNEHQMWIRADKFKGKKFINGCLKCVGHCPEEAEKKFIAAVEALGGRVIGEYIHSQEKIHCICKNGHDCYIKTSWVNSGGGICLACVGLCPVEAEAKFRRIITELGGQVIGEYITNIIKVKCICKNNHECNIRPDSVAKGHGMCIICADRSVEECKRKFKEEMLERGYTINGEYEYSDVHVECTCDIGHKFKVKPSEVQQGRGYCYTCHPVSIQQQKTGKALEKLKLDYREEYSFEGTTKRYDFKVGNFIIEVDGSQHFKVANLFMPTEEKLLANQKNDRRKMSFIFEKGFKMIRFDYSYSKQSVDYIAAQIKHAMILLEDEDKHIYLSKPIMYTWLNLNSDIIVTDNVPIDTSQIKKKKKVKVVVKNNVDVSSEEKITVTNTVCVNNPDKEDIEVVITNTIRVTKKKSKIVVINKKSN